MPTPQGQRENDPVLVAQPEQKYYFAPVLFSPSTISILLSYTKIVKIAALRSVFKTKNSANAFAAGGLTRISYRESFLDSWGLITNMSYDFW